MSAAAGAFDGRIAYVDALRQTLLDACAETGANAREMRWQDASFALWPLSDSEVLDALAAWARRPGRRLQMLALEYEELRRLHPRFVRWRVLFDHCVEARSYEPEAAGRAGIASGLIASGREAVISLRLFDERNWRGVVSRLPADALRTGEFFDALTQRSALSFPSTTFGL